MGEAFLSNSTHCSPIIPPVKNDLVVMEEGKIIPAESSIQNMIVTPSNAPKVSQHNAQFIVFITGL